MKKWLLRLNLFITAVALLQSEFYGVKPFSRVVQTPEHGFQCFQKPPLRSCSNKQSGWGREARRGMHSRPLQPTESTTWVPVLPGPVFSATLESDGHGKWRGSQLGSLIFGKQLAQGHTTSYQQSQLNLGRMTPKSQTFSVSSKLIRKKAQQHLGSWNQQCLSQRSVWGCPVAFLLSHCTGHLHFPPHLPKAPNIRKASWPHPASVTRELTAAVGGTRSN